MSNILDLYPDGFASGRNNRPVSSARHLPLPLCWDVAGLQHAGATNPNQCKESGKEGGNFPKCSIKCEFFSDFAFHTDAKGHRVAQDFGTGLVYVHSPNVTSVTFNATFIWRFQGENLTWQNGPDVVFRGLPQSRVWLHRTR